MGKRLRLRRGRGWWSCGGLWHRLWFLGCRWWCRLLCLPPCDLRPERHSRWVDGLGRLSVGCCRHGSCLCCCRPGCGGGRTCHGGVFLCSRRRRKAPNPVGRDGLLVHEEIESRETWEVGSVAAQTFGCGGVGCGEEAASSCPHGHRGSAGRKQRGCGRPRLKHNRRPRATSHGEGVRGGFSQRLKGTTPPPLCFFVFFEII